MPSPFPALGKPLGRALPKLRAGGKLTRPRGVHYGTPRSLNYARIKAEFLVAVEQLGARERAQIPATGTLPEQMVAYALVKLGLPFVSQWSELGGRLWLGGSVVDFEVALGGSVVVVRVMGDYWHSLPDRKLKDAVQYDRLHRAGYRVADLWERAIYQAWVDGRLLRFVEQAVLEAA
jgi:hypothetical protein